MHESGGLAGEALSRYLDAIDLARKLRSYAAAKRSVMPDVEHRPHKGLNNRAESSHVPIRKRERMMQGFRSWSGLQRFVPIFSAVSNFFVPLRSHRSACVIHLHRLRVAERRLSCIPQSGHDPCGATGRVRSTFSTRSSLCVFRLECSISPRA